MGSLVSPDASNHDASGHKRGLVSVIIVNFNGRGLLSSCLPSVLRQTYQRREVIVVDNGSSDDSVVFLHEQYPNIDIIEVGFNSGFAHANNLGVAAARGEFLFFLNNDTELDPSCLERFVQVMEQAPSSVGSCSGKVLSYQQRTVIDNTGHLVYPDGLTRGRGRLEIDRGQYDHDPVVPFPSGCAAFYRRAVLDQVGLMDGRFFLYCEDADLGFRALLAGWSCRYVPEAVIYHKYSATAGRYSSIKAFYVERNRIWLLWKVFPGWLIVFSFWFTFQRLLYNVYSVVSGRGQAGKFVRGASPLRLATILIRSWLWAGIGLPATLRDRRITQRTRTVTNREIWSWFRRYGVSARDLTLTD